MKVDKAGIEFIIQQEGIVLHSYLDSGGILTLGVGSTGKHVKPNQKITREEAIKLLYKDLDRFEKAVSKAVKVPINQREFNALTSFTFNLGEGSLLKSSLLKYINSGKPYDPVHIIKLFGLWQNVEGRPSQSIYNRRVREARLFLS